MSMLRRIAGDILGLLFPRICPVCGDLLVDNERFICTACRYRAPLTDFCNLAENPMTERLAGLLPARNASAFLWYIPDSGWQRMIHSFKYDGKWLYARRIGEWFGSQLADSGLYGDIDLIVPVPLHWRKRLRRGYNQSEYIADGIASAMGVEVDRRSVVRRINNPSQTRRTAVDRWNNVEGIFSVRRPEALRGKHILIVDDVFTTGATIIECGSAILASVGGDAVLSVATIAVSQHHMAFDR